MENAQLPNEVVKGCPEVVDGISDNAPEISRGFTNWARVQREFPWDHIHVALDLEGVRVTVDKGPGSPLERADVYVRSLDPLESSF